MVAEAKLPGHGAGMDAPLDASAAAEAEMRAAAAREHPLTERTVVAIYIGGGAGVVSVAWERAFWGWWEEQQEGEQGGAGAQLGEYALLDAAALEAVADLRAFSNLKVRARARAVHGAGCIVIGWVGLRGLVRATLSATVSATHCE